MVVCIHVISRVYGLSTGEHMEKHVVGNTFGKVVQCIGSLCRLPYNRTDRFITFTHMLRMRFIRYAYNNKSEFANMLLKCVCIACTI